MATPGHGPPTNCWCSRVGEAEQGPVSPSIHVHVLSIPTPAPHPTPALPVLQPRDEPAPPLGMAMAWWDKERGPQRQPRAGWPQQGPEQSLREKSPSTAGSGSGPTQGCSASCLSITASVKRSFCPASLSPSPSLCSSYSSSQKASTSEHFKIQGDSIERSRFLFFFFPSSSLISSIFHTKCLQALCRGR